MRKLLKTILDHQRCIGAATVFCKPKIRTASHTAIVLLFWSCFFTYGQRNSQLNKNERLINTIAEAVEEHHLNGLSFAVVENYEAVLSETIGIKDVNSKCPIDTLTSFSSASISKPITALLFAMLEEKGKIDLKKPVSVYLKRYKLPESKWIKSTPPTLEHLLSHTSGTSQHGFADYYHGDSIPDLLQSLKGEIPQYDSEIEFLFEPGTQWKYSGGGYVLAQVALEDHLGKSLAAIAEEYLFGPLELKRTTMKQPNESGFLQNIALAHNEEGEIIRDGIPITPQVAASGMWTNPMDLSKIVIEIQKALAGKNTSVISNEVANRVTEIQTIYGSGGWSLGWERNKAYGNIDWFSHGGANTGTGGYVYGSMQDGKGIVIFGNGPNSMRMPMEDIVVKSVIKEFDWDKPLDLTDVIPLKTEEAELFTGTYKNAKYGALVDIMYDQGSMFAEPFIGGEKTELHYLGDGTFKIDEFPNMLKFEIDSETRTPIIRFSRPKERLTSEKILTKVK
nr:serine hydrolase domain-containing protein [Allomuricauda sp.]